MKDQRELTAEEREELRDRAEEAARGGPGGCVILSASELLALLDERERLVRERDEARAARCAPIDLEIVGYPRATVSPAEAETDRATVGGAACRRVVLTPDRPSVEVRLAPGRWVRLRAWATQTDQSAPCPHAAALRRLVGMHEAEHAVLHDDDDGTPVPIDRCPVRFCQAAAAVRALVHERTEAHETPTRPALTAENRAALRQTAEAATPGGWVAVEAPQGWWTVESPSEDWRVADSLDKVDAEYVAAAHPQAVLALLAAHDALRGALKTAEGLVAQVERERQAAERERDALAGALRDLWGAAESSPDLCTHPAVERAEQVLAARRPAGAPASTPVRLARGMAPAPLGDPESCGPPREA